MLGMDTYM
jgi:hypothetical protein